MPVNTASNGIATDILEVRLQQDPESVNVTVQATNISATLAVPKTVSLGPVDPVADITATPAIGVRFGNGFTFSSAPGSTHDPEVEFTCFEWTITSATAFPCPPNNVMTTNCLVRNPGAVLVQLQIGQLNVPAPDQNLQVKLQVSDEQGPCSQTQAPEFPPTPDVLDYQLKCDFTPPANVNAGPSVVTVSQSSSVNGFVSVTLQGSAFDAESSTLEYRWDCGPAGVSDPPNGIAQSVSCTYPDTVAQHTVTLDVQNLCGLIESDSLVVNIVQ
jgi:hypothetical protein